MNFRSVNWAAVIVATLATFVVGFLWYGPLFGVSWQRLVGFSDADLQEGNMALTFGLAFVLEFIIATLLAMLLPAPRTAGTGLRYGLLIGAGFVATAMGVNSLFSRDPLSLWAIDAGYMVVVFMVIGAIIGAWPGRRAQPVG